MRDDYNLDDMLYFKWMQSMTPLHKTREIVLIWFFSILTYKNESTNLTN